MTAYPDQTQTTVGQLCAALWDSPITAGCDSAWIQTRDCSVASYTEMQCLRPLPNCKWMLLIELLLTVFSSVSNSCSFCLLATILQAAKATGSFLFCLKCLHVSVLPVYFGSFRLREKNAQSISRRHWICIEGYTLNLFFLHKHDMYSNLEI